MKGKLNQYFFTPLLLSSLVGCGTGGEKAREKTQEHGIELSNMDQKTRPGNDFYEYANGGWLARTEIPSDEIRWGSFSELNKSNEAILKNLLEKAVKSQQYAPSSDQGKAVSLYKIGMDTARIEKMGLQPIAPFLKKINALKNTKALPELLAHLHSYGIGGFFSQYVYIDKKDSKTNALYLVADGLGLPDRDFYTEVKFEKSRKQYKAHLQRMFELMGDPSAAASKKAAQVFELELSLAKKTLTRTERRDPKKTYNKMSLAGLNRSNPGFDFAKYFHKLGFGKIPYIIVEQPAFIQEVNALVQSTSVEQLKAYLQWKLINGSAAYLTKDVREQDWKFYSQQLRGAKEMKPRWKTVLASVNGKLGFALGQAYVDEVFPPEAKKKAQAMVNNIQATFGDRIDQLEWMSDETKQKAKQKLKSFGVKIGYPDKWESYEKLRLTPEMSFAEAYFSSNIFEHKKNVADLYKPIDKGRWFMTPQTVNAYYSPSKNEIVFPAAILQPPFYDYKADEAVNYGGIGAVIGHEMTHGFDDQGRQYDAEGNLKDWWTEADADRFDKRAQKVVKQFDEYVVLDSMHVNGKLTLGENIADLGGITLAYHALQKHMAENGRPEKIDGLTPEQRLFVSWATIWRCKYRPEALKDRLTTDVHAPAMIRGFAPLSNLNEFEDAFKLKETDKMVRADSLKIKIW